MREATGELGTTADWWLALLAVECAVVCLLMLLGIQYMWLSACRDPVSALQR